MEPDEIREPVTKEVRLLVPIEKNQAEAKRVTYGVVLEPDTEDLQGDVMTAEDIEAAAYDWMERSQAGGHMHSQRIEGAKVVESYIAPCDIPVETPTGRETIRKGSWVLAMRWPEEVWESIAKGALTGYSVGGTGVRLALEEIGKKGKWAPGPNAGWRLASGDPARDGAAAEGGGTPADQGAAAARRDDAGRGSGGKYKKGDVVQLKDGGTGEIVDYEPGKYGAADEYAIAPEDLGEGGPKAVWVRADEIEAAEWELEGYPSGTVDDEERYPTGGKWQGELSDAEREDAEWKAGYGKDASQGWEAEAGYKTFTRGQKVRTATGQIRTIHSQRGSQVFVEEESNGWYHPDKLWPVKKSAEEEALAEAVRQGLRDAVAKHGSHDQSSHGNWARGGKSGLGDGEEFVTGDRVRLQSNEQIDWGGLNGATGRIAEVTPGSLGWPTVYSVKLDREWVGWEDDDTIRDLEADRLTMLRRVRKHGSGDQSPHGNWARGGGQQTPRERSWERHLTAPTPEERRQAGDDYVRYADAEDAAQVAGGGRKHTTRDGVVVEDQPKVTRVGGEQYQIAKPEGQVILNFGEWKWTGSGKSPKVTERGNWAVWPRHKKHNGDNLIRTGGHYTLGELMGKLPPGEYDLAP